MNTRDGRILATGGERLRKTLNKPPRDSCSQEFVASFAAGVPHRAAAESADPGPQAHGGSQAQLGIGTTRGWWQGKRGGCGVPYIRRDPLKCFYLAINAIKSALSLPSTPPAISMSASPECLILAKHHPAPAGLRFPGSSGCLSWKFEGVRARENPEAAFAPGRGVGRCGIRSRAGSRCHARHRRPARSPAGRSSIAS